MSDPHDDSLSDRARHLLRVLVESYIREGLPVGSRTLSRYSGLVKVTNAMFFPPFLSRFYTDFSA